MGSRKIIRIIFLLIFLPYLFSCAPKLVLEETGFEKLTNWGGNSDQAALLSFLNSCKKITDLPDDFNMGIAGTPKDWLSVCYNAQRYYDATKMGERRFTRFFQKYFTPHKAYNHFSREGLFTGYYEPALRGSLTRTEKYKYPLYKRPEDLVNGEPYIGRKTIEEGALEDKDLELVYVDDPVDLFFLHVQGSGRILLDDGRVMRVGYDGKNYCPYQSIGKYLINEGELKRGEVTAKSIKQWLRENPQRAMEVMQTNQAYIFFKQLNGKGPFGAQEVVLTPEASIAIDKAYIPYGVPIWLQTTIFEGDEEIPYYHLLIAQDTGGAIQGPVRGDIFFGYGKKAEEKAGNMKQTGEYYILLPKGIKHNE